MPRSAIPFFLLAAAIIVSGCGNRHTAAGRTTESSPVVNEADSGDDTFRIIPDPSGKPYFPEGKASWYTRYLSSMREPSLLADLPEGSSFALRFTLMPAFSDNLVVRIYDQNGKVSVRAVRQKKDENYHPAGITDDRTFNPGTSGLPEAVKEWFNSQEFWRPLNGQEEDLRGFDGARWLFERRDPTGYYLMNLWSPDEPRESDEMLEGAGFDPSQIRRFDIYVTAGDQLLKLAGLALEAGEMAAPGP